MSAGALEASVTLEEVFAVVGSKRVPLAPELAGYLALEIAERADTEGGDIEPKSVFVSEEGTVALVKPRRDATTGDVESSIRAVLARLLDASGSQTPALAATSRRKSGVGLRALAQELEAALIPVNRAAGRRALARLAREVKRVTLGIGRHTLPSSPDSLRASARGHPASSTDLPEPSSRRAGSPDFQVLSSERTSQETLAPAPPQPTVRFSPEPEEDATTARERLPDELRKRKQADDHSEMPTTQFRAPREPSPSQTDVDDLIADFAVSGGGDQTHARELRALAGLDLTPPPPRPRPSEARGVPGMAKPGSVDSDIEALLGLGHDSSEGAGSSSLPSTASSTSDGAKHPGGEKRRLDPRQLPTQPSQLRQSRAAPKSRASPSRGGSWAVLGIAFLAMGAGAYAVSELRPGLFRARGSDQRKADTIRADGPGGLESTPSLPGTASCKGTLVVTDVPQRAEVLLRVGRAPVDVDRMPVGARLEFVATAEGFAAKRVVVPSGARWESGPDGKPRFEAAVQLEPSLAHLGAADRWPAGEPGSAVGGQGPAGTIHVASSPAGAEVWMLAGIGPEARIEQLSCDKEIEVLIAGPAATRNRLRVGTRDFVLDVEPDAAMTVRNPTRVARVSAK